MQAAPSDAVSQAPVPVSESDPVSQHGMGTVQQQAADTEQGSEMMGEGDGEEVVSVHVESSESLQPTTSQSGQTSPELVIPVSLLAGAGQEVMEGGEEVEVRAADERPEQLLQPAEQALKPVEQVVHVRVYVMILVSLLVSKTGFSGGTSPATAADIARAGQTGF